MVVPGAAHENTIDNRAWERRDTLIEEHRCSPGNPQSHPALQQIDEDIFILRDLFTRTLRPSEHHLQKVAIAFRTEPVAPGTAAGEAVTKKSQRFRLAASLLTASRSRLSKMGIPMAMRTRA